MVERKVEAWKMQTGGAWGGYTPAEAEKNAIIKLNSCDLVQFVFLENHFYFQ